MSDTYKAVEVTAPGTLRLVERPSRKPGVGQVRIRVEACGIRLVCISPETTTDRTAPFEEDRDALALPVRSR
jgi:hypothetical protein